MDAMRFEMNTRFGLDIVEASVRIVPKLQIRDDVPMTDAFREEMNDWLLETFGSIDLSPIPKGVAYMFGNTIVMRPEMAVMLHNCAA